MESNIKNLIIDFGGVLIDLNRKRCIDAFKALGVTDIEQMIDPYLQQGLFLKLEKGEITSSEFRDEIRKRTETLITDKQINKAWNCFLVGIPTYKLDLLLKLREQYTVYLLSNTNEIHWKWACENCFAYQEFQVQDYFEKMYISFIMHQVKPAKEIFETLLDDSGIDPAETLFVDDAIANCQVAESLGIKTYMPEAEEDWSHIFE